MAVQVVLETTLVLPSRSTVSSTASLLAKHAVLHVGDYLFSLHICRPITFLEGLKICFIVFVLLCFLPTFLYLCTTYYKSFTCSHPPKIQCLKIPVQVCVISGWPKLVLALRPPTTITIPNLWVLDLAMGYVIPSCECQENTLTPRIRNGFSVMQIILVIQDFFKEGQVPQKFVKLEDGDSVPRKDSSISGMQTALCKTGDIAVITTCGVF